LRRADPTGARDLRGGAGGELVGVSVRSPRCERLRLRERT